MFDLEDCPADFFKYDPSDELAAAAWNQIWEYELSRKPLFSVIKYNLSEGEISV